MDLWNDLSTLPDFWTPLRVTFGVANVLVIAAVTGDLLLRAYRTIHAKQVAGGATPQEARIVARLRMGDEANVVAIVAGGVSLAVWMLLGFHHAGTHTEAVADIVVTYVEENHDLTVLSPVDIGGSQLYETFPTGPNATFNAVTDAGDIVDVRVTWLDPQTRTYRSGAELPASLDPFTVTITSDQDD